MNQYKEYLSITSDFISILVAAYGIIYGLSKKTKSLNGFIVSQWVSRIFKTGLIIFISGVVFEIVKSLATSIINDLKSFSEIFIFFSLTLALSVFFLWLIIPIIWTSSLIYAIEFLNLLLPKSFKINTTEFRNEIIFRIDKAVYGKNNWIDVTEKLQKMIKNNSLEITASNSLAGDPEPTVKKELIIDYTINGVAKREVIIERDTKIIPN